MSASRRCLTGLPASRLAGNDLFFLVVISHEMIHDVRIIPLSGAPFVDGRIRQWMGDSRAHWDGDALVVETRNFHNRGWIASSAAGGRIKGIPTSPAMQVMERFERVSETTIMWTVTIEDPNVYTAPWTIQMPLTAEPGYQMFEYACHEGNHAVPGTLSGQRYLDANTETDGQQ